MNNAGSSGSSTVTWTGSGCTITSITFGNPGPPANSTFPTSGNGWTLTYNNPNAQAKWNYTIGATSPFGQHLLEDPEIDNGN